MHVIFSEPRNISYNVNLLFYIFKTRSIKENQLTLHPSRRTGFHHFASASLKAIRIQEESMTKRTKEIEKQHFYFRCFNFDIFSKRGFLRRNLHRRERYNRSWADICLVREQDVSVSCHDLVYACGPHPLIWRLSPDMRLRADVVLLAIESLLEFGRERPSRHHVFSVWTQCLCNWPDHKLSKHVQHE